MKALKRYADRRIHKLLLQLKKYDGDNSQIETLHNLRVEVKKIKALLQLINFCVKSFHAHKNFIPFRTIFRKAGEIRQPTVFYSLLQTYHLESLADTIILESAQSKQRSRAFRKHIPDYISRIHRCKKKLSRYLDKVEKRCLKKYIKLKRKELKARLYPRLNLALLHKTRKIFKEIVYLDQVGNKGNKTPAFYKETESLIGQWHDKKMLILILKKNNNVKEVNRLASECRTDILNLKRQIRSFYTGDEINAKKQTPDT